MDEDKAGQLLKKGAEANLYIANWHGRRVVFKKRIPKKYRHARLDAEIRTYRTIHEPLLMHEAKRAGVPTPTIFSVDVKNAVIVMQYVKGMQVKQLLNTFSEEQRSQLCIKMGQEIAKLHKFGLIHGDLTTSNMIMNSERKLFFVDFGLSEKNDELEAKGVNLHLMKRALQSTHYQFAESCFDSVIEGYGSMFDARTLENILRKIIEIERRGRYVEERRQEDLSD